jgi:LmbE family N-acetylglucosaminyl deacetylase
MLSPRRRRTSRALEESLSRAAAKFRGSLPDDLIPLKRPQFELRGRQLFFLSLNRARVELDSDDAALWNRIDGSATLGQLRDSDPEVEPRLRRFWDLGICELRPLRFPENRKRVLVVEPHMDDAVLSVGGLMWSLREECEFAVVSVSGRSIYTAPVYRDRELFGAVRTSALRKAESALVTRLLGGRFTTLDEPDAPLRYQPGECTFDWYRDHQALVDAFVDHYSSDQEIESWAASIERLLATTDAQEIWLPLGVGGQADHELTRNACLRALGRLRGVEDRIALFFYQDVPYSVRFPAHTEQILDAFTAAGGTLRRQAEDIAEVLGDKVRLMSIYESQFRLSEMAAEVVAAARRASPSGEGFCELRFKVTALPGPIDPLSAYSGRGAVENLVMRLDAWYRRHRSALRIRVISLVPIGRWAEDLSFLLEAFPDAVLEVHICEAGASELGRLMSPRIEVRTVAGRARAWLGIFLNIAVTRPSPLVLLTGKRRKAAAWIAKALCFTSDPLSAANMNNLVLALRVVRRFAK